MQDVFFSYSKRFESSSEAFGFIDTVSAMGPAVQLNLPPQSPSEFGTWVLAENSDFAIVSICASLESRDYWIQISANSTEALVHFASSINLPIDKGEITELRAKKIIRVGEPAPRWNQGFRQV